MTLDLCATSTSADPEAKETTVKTIIMTSATEEDNHQ